MNDPIISKKDAKGLIKPVNLFKTVAVSFPVAASVAEALTQLEGMKTEARLVALESNSEILPPPHHDWSVPVGEYLQRTVDLAVIYDGGYHSSERSGYELLQPVAHACLIGNEELLACREALETLELVAREKKGKAVVLIGFAQHEFLAGEVDDASGLSVCRIGRRDEAKWTTVKEVWDEHDLGEVPDRENCSPIKSTIHCWMGQELGFLYTGEAKNSITPLDAFSERQFDFSTVSHIRKPERDGLRKMVSGVLPSRILFAGAPAFTRDGTLVGIISDMDSYESDAGRRAVIRGLIGHPRFTKRKIPSSS